MDVVNHYKGKLVSQRSSLTNLCRSPWCKQPLSDEGYKNKVPIPAPELSESWLWSDVWAFGKYENATMGNTELIKRMRTHAHTKLQPITTADDNQMNQSKGWFAFNLRLAEKSEVGLSHNN